MTRCIPAPRHRPSAALRRVLAAGIALALLSVGCGASRRGGEPSSLTLKELIPLRDRDHYVYVWQRLVEGVPEAEGLHVEHTSALPEENAFEVSVSEDGTLAARLRFHNDGERVLLLSEDDVESGIRRSYDPPLVHLSAPIRMGESGMRSTAVVTQIEDGTQIARVDISQRLRISEASDVVSALGNFDTGVLVEARRTVHTPSGDIELLSAAVLVPGIGEIRSEGTTLSSEDIRADGTPEIHTVLRRELACALIGQRALGNCRDVEHAIEALRSSRP